MSKETIQEIKELEATELSSVKDLAEKLKELQRSSIPKEEYDAAVRKLREENSQLITALTENRPIILNEEESNNAERVSMISGKIRLHANGEKKLSDKELLRAALEQRDLTLELSGVDTLIGRTIEGHEPVITKEDADEMALGLREVLNYADVHHLELTDAIKSMRAKGELKLY